MCGGLVVLNFCNTSRYLRSKFFEMARLAISLQLYVFCPFCVVSMVFNNQSLSFNFQCKVKQSSMSHHHLFRYDCRLSIGQTNHVSERLTLLSLDVE